MSQSIILLIAIITIPFVSFSQEKLGYIDLEKVMDKTYDYFSDDDYNKAFEELSLISESDTSYFDNVLTEQLYALINSEKYEEAEILAKKYWNDKNYLPQGYYLNYGAILDDLEKFDEAKAYYEDILKEYPLNYLLWYNYGVSRMKAKDLNGAFDLFKKVLQINPNYSKTHFQIAKLALNQKQTTKALLAFNMFLIMEAEFSNTTANLLYISEVSNSKYWDEEDFEFHEFPMDNTDDFSDIDELVHGYVALNAKYKTKSKIETFLPLIKQSHLIFSQLKDYKSESFWYKNYIQFYQEIMAKKQFSTFSYWISMNVNQSYVENTVYKNKKHFRPFKSQLDKSIYEANKTPNLEFAGFDKNQEVYRSGSKMSIVILGKVNDITNQIEGDVRIINSQGSLSASGTFNEGNKTGEWKYFYPTGTIKEISNYTDGKPNGESITYNPEGVIATKIIYENGIINGDVTLYKNGFTSAKLPYSSGKLGSGLYETYYINGQVNLTYNFVEGQPEGEAKEFYIDGSLYSSVNYVDGNKVGEEITYFGDGKIYTKKNYVDGELSGEFTEYHSNETIAVTGSYLKDKKSGEWMYKDKNGQLETKESFDESGKKTGVSEEYTLEGWKLSEMIYKKGQIIGYKFFNKEGDILSEGTMKGGDYYYKSYYYNGNVEREGTFGKDNRDGLWSFYDINGNLSSQENYNKGELIKNTSFFTDSVVEAESNYKNGLVDGYFYEKYRNGKIFRQGNFKNGSSEQTWKFYNRAGQLTEEKYYIDDQLHGYKREYSIEGKLYTTTFYRKGHEVYMVLYDSLEIAVDTFFNRPDIKEIKLRECKDCFISAIKEVSGDLMHGEQTYFHPNGKVKSKGQYLNGNKIGEWKSYHDNGQLKQEKTYNNNNQLHGVVTNYYPNGKILDKTNYVNGNTEGEVLSYDRYGNIESKMMYVDGYIHGLCTYYIDGKEEHSRKYAYDVIVAVQYTDKNGKKIEEKVMNETFDAEFYWSNGKISRKFQLKKGYFEGEYLKFYFNGNPCREDSMENSWSEGDFKFFHPNGKVFREGFYKADQYDGWITEYHLNGKIKSVTFYIQGVISKTQKKYNETGILIQENQYYNGNIVSQKNY